MPLSAAEKQRRYRQKRDQDPQLREEYLAKEKQRWQERKQAGKIKLINSLSDREKRTKCKSWRKAWKTSQDKKRRQLYDTPLTPNQSADDIVPVEAQPDFSRQHKRGRKCVRKERARCYSRLRSLEEKVSKQTRIINRYKQKLSRLQRKSSTTLVDSPRTKTRKLMRHLHVQKDHVAKILTFHYAVMDNIKKKYKETTREREKKAIARLFSHKILKKYKMKKLAQKSIGISQRRWLSNEKRIRKVNSSVTDKVKTFFLRDDVSRMTTGRKQTLTLHKNKQQKRLLTDSMKNQHLKFLAENEHLKCSYSLFCKLRPFYCVKPNNQDRETCQCKNHENLLFMASKLKYCNVIETDNIEAMAESLSCHFDLDVEDRQERLKQCAYGNCTDCKFTTVNPNEFEDREVSFFQWKHVNKTYTKSDETLTAKVMTKENQTVCLSDLVEKFQDSLAKFKRHNFSIHHQFKMCREMKMKLDENECVIHVDFSENYNCKYSNEIQSMHFGASQNQATLHTGMIYLHNQQEPFCSISPSNDHSPSAIWAHLEPVLNNLLNQPTPKTQLHMWSDSPSTHYRQKANFYLLSHLPFKKGFTKITWIFFESGHGKGAPDGVGGALKRSADRLVSHGKDIPSAEVLYKELKAKSLVKLYYIPVENIQEISKLIPKDLPTIPGTMKVHQVVSDHPQQMSYKDLSCLHNISTCNCYDAKMFCFHDDLVTQLNSVAHATGSNVSSVAHATGSNADSILRPVSEVSRNLVEQHCIVRYENIPYPGIILETDDTDVLVKCMHRSGENKYYWPKLRDDICWYAYSDVLTLSEEPIPVTRRKTDSSRHFQIESSMWNEVMKAM